MFSDRKRKKSTADFTKEQNKIAEGTIFVDDIKRKLSDRRRRIGNLLDERNCEITE